MPYEVYAALDACPICASTAPRQSIFRVQDGPAIDMLQCEKCHGCSASQMPTKAVLDRYYDEYYVQSARRSTCPDPKRYARHITAHMPGLFAKNAVNILDFGGGDGVISAAIGRLITEKTKDVEVRIDVVDYEQPGSYHADNIRLFGYRELSEVSGSYDLILASAILEHIPKLNEVILRLTAFSERDCYFYSRTPFMVPIARAVGKIDITYPAHVHDMGGRFWANFARTFSLSASLVRSQPSLVETAFTENPSRSIIAALMKLPAHLQLSVSGYRGSVPIWPFVGGWEAVYRFHK